MIERIQSVFLFVIGVCMVVCMFVPVWQKENSESKEKTTLNLYKLNYTKDKQIIKSSPTFYIAILAGFAALTAFYSIFQYKNRLRQMKLGLLNSLLMSGVLGLMVYFIFQGEESFPKPEQGAYEIGFYLPIIALICNLLSNRFIKRDEMLVRSADRMR